MKIRFGTADTRAALVSCSPHSLTRFYKKGERDILEIGTGKREIKDARKVQLLLRRLVREAKSRKLAHVHLSFEELVSIVGSCVDQERLAYLMGENFELANFEFTVFKTKGKESGRAIEEITIDGTPDASLKKTLAEGQLVGQEMNACRALCNTPGGDMTPSRLAEAAQLALKGTKASVKVLGKKAMEKIGMGAVLGVARGSTEEPKFIVIEYWGRGKGKEEPIVLCGKGVTFDTGGLNLKPSDGILDMHLDMSGGAVVIHSLAVTAKLGLKRNVIGLIPAVENMPSGSSYRPGDILTSLSGKTIEVLNTDAEGRVILADALTYAKRYNPSLVLDIATLTGAALAALGQHASAIMTRDEKLSKDLIAWGETSGDYVWPLPLWEEYEPYVKGNFGDLANLPSSGNQRYGGAIHGGMFLLEFAKDFGRKTTWAHIDMAPRMTSAPGDQLAKGATGEPLRLIIEAIKHFSP